MTTPRGASSWIKRPPKLTLAASHRVSHGMRCDDLFGSRHFVRRLMARACGAEHVVPLEPVARRRAWPAGRDSRSGRPRRGRLGEALARRALRARGRGAPRGAAARRYGGAHERSIRLRSCRRARARARDRPKKTVGRCSRRAREKCATESRGLFVARAHPMPPYWRVVTLCGAPDTARAARRLRSFHRDDLGRDRERLASPKDPGPPRPGPHGFGTPYEPISWPRRAR